MSVTDNVAVDSGADRARDPNWYRQVMGQYPTGVCVITATTEDNQPVGLTVGSFTSVSLDPPLVAFLPSATSSSWPKIAATKAFCVNVLGADQEYVCRAFAAGGADKFAGLSWRPADSGSPILQGSVAWIDCDLETVHESGDHLIVIGRVRDMSVEQQSLPLLFFQGGYGRFSPHSLATRDAAFRQQLGLVDSARPLMEDLAALTNTQVVAAYCDGTELTLLAKAGSACHSSGMLALIGQHVPVVAPLGIWWMAFAPSDVIDRWLGSIASPQLKERYLQALAAVRERGYCLGLAAVHDEVGSLIGERDTPIAPTASERRAIASLTINPADYVPAPSEQSAPYSKDHQRARIVGFWAPTFTPHGDVALGLGLVGPPLEESPQQHLDAFMDTVHAISALAAR